MAIIYSGTSLIPSKWDITPLIRTPMGLHNPSNQDTNGTVSILVGCPHFRAVLREGFHCANLTSRHGFTKETTGLAKSYLPSFRLNQRLCQTALCRTAEPHPLPRPHPLYCVRVCVWTKKYLQVVKLQTKTTLLYKRWLK